VKTLAAVALFAAGVICGGCLFADTAPRSLLALTECTGRCTRPSELAGLLASVVIQRAPFAVPGVVLESDTCLAIRYPKPESRVHFVLFPKRDIRNATTLTDADTPYVIGCFVLARELVAREHLQTWRIQTNGPGFQDVAYLHFHLVSR